MPGGAAARDDGHVAAAPPPAALAGDVVVAFRRLMAGAPASTAHTWVFEDRSAVIAALDRLGDLVGVYRSHLLTAQKADRRWASEGDRSFEGHRGRTAGTGFGAARREMELAEGLSSLPQAARAVEDGDVGLAHAGVLTRLHARSSEPVRAALAAGGTDELLAAARRMDAAQFAKRADAWAAAQDADAAERAHRDVRRRRYCRVADREGGTRLDAFVDPVVGATIRTALEALTPVPAADDDRTPEQRRADALAALAARVLDRGADKIGAQIRPHISLIVPAETWAAVRARRSGTDGTREGALSPSAATSAPHASSGTGDAPLPSSRPGDLARPPARSGSPETPTPRRSMLPMPELDDGTVLPLSEVERIACDCELTRIVMDADGVPLDVGQSQRTYQKALRRAVLVRDRHCRWPGCTLRASWCEVHHVLWYSEGGVTSVENALTLCSFHHHEVHRRKIEIRSTAQGHVFATSDGRRLGKSERHHLLAPPMPTPDLLGAPASPDEGEGATRADPAQDGGCAGAEEAGGRSGTTRGFGEHEGPGAAAEPMGTTEHVDDTFVDPATAPLWED